ncbi:MAG: AzlD domain-containing protein [Candidatus Hodarchaeales archaeon]|jgi:branched-subunit amino acid transport protein
MENYQTHELLIVFLIIGSSTFLIRAIFLFKLPNFVNENKKFRKGLESVPSSLLVALVIPYAFFTEANLLLFRPEVFAILITIPVIWITKKPGMSLIIAIIVLGTFNFLTSFL